MHTLSFSRTCWNDIWAVVTSIIRLFHLCLQSINTWSIWFTVQPSGDAHVALCTRLWAKYLSKLITLSLPLPALLFSKWCWTELDLMPIFSSRSSYLQLSLLHCSSSLFFFVCSLDVQLFLFPCGSLSNACRAVKNALVFELAEPCSYQSDGKYCGVGWWWNDKSKVTRKTVARVALL